MKERIDILLVERRLVESRTKAQWLIKNGYVLVEGKIIKKTGKKIDCSQEIRLLKEFPYVGKGGIKLEAALKEFSIKVENKVCADIGASIGGFTDCLLKHGAKKVYAIDTASDLLHPSLQCNKMKNKVIPLLGIDARLLLNLEEKIDICTIDVTFVSLKVILPNVKQILNLDGDIIALVKPLFERDYLEEPRLKVIKDHEVFSNILYDIREWAIEHNIYPHGIIKSPLLGKGGSREFFFHFRIDEKNFRGDFRKRIDKIFIEDKDLDD